MQSFKAKILQFSGITLLRNAFLYGFKLVLVSKLFWAQGSKVLSKSRLFVGDLHQRAISRQLQGAPRC
jgi:hypothetical protein